VPFFSSEVYDVVNEYYDPDGLGGLIPPQLALNSTNLYMIESEGSDPRYFQSWVHISGEGEAQKSAAFLFAGGMFEDGDGNLQMNSSRRGTYRSDAYFGPVNMRGGAATRPGATGAHLYGPNVDNFVIGTSVDPADAFNDVPLDYGEIFPNGGGLPYATTHVASLIGERAVADYGTPVHPVGRTSRDVSGFIAGMGEGFVGEDVYEKEAPYVLAAAGPNAGPNFELSLDTDTNQVRARAEVFDLLDQNEVVESMLVRFGPHNGDSGGNAFIDDHIFGAQKNNGPENTRLRTDEGANLAHTGSFSPGSYLVSGRANPIDVYQHLEGCDTCDFIDWGWWGTRVETDANIAEGVPNERRDFVHMGTWVAGELTDPAELASFDPGSLPFGGSATYSGTALGTVARESQGSVAQYIARGNFTMGYDFAVRSGSFDLSFDGETVGGPIGDNYANPTGNFGGNLAGSVSGTVSGSFVGNGPNVAAGVIGNFTLGSGNMSAVGTIAGTANTN
jgi:hypothetical protein